MFTEWSKPYLFTDDANNAVGLSVAERKTMVLYLMFRTGAEPSKMPNSAGQYDNVVQVQIAAPGQAHSFPIYEVQRVWPDGTVKRSEPKQWERFGRVFNEFLANNEPAKVGTPLEEWPLMQSMALIRAFKDVNIHSVQDLAAMGEHAHGNVKAPSREWQAKAKNWLEDRAQNAPHELEAENAALKARMAKLEEQLSKLQLVSSVTEDEAPPRRRGRPPKARADAPPSVAFEEEEERL